MKTARQFFVLCFSLLFFSPAITHSQQWQVYTSGRDITALAGEGNFLWVGTSGGLVKLDKTTGTPTFYDKTNSGLPFNAVSCIAIDQNGNKWIGTEGHGLAKFDGTNWTVYTKTNSGLPNNWITALQSIQMEWYGWGQVSWIHFPISDMVLSNSMARIGPYLRKGIQVYQPVRLSTPSYLTTIVLCG